MNRNEEYYKLLSEFEQTPPALNYTVQRAQARNKRRRRLRTFLGIPVGSLAVFLISFTCLVNFLPPFAMACGDIPILRGLAKSVSWSPSLSAAVENEYVQPINQKQTINGITVRVEYVIVDQKQVNFFYTLDAANDAPLEADSNLLGVDGGALEGFSLHSGNYGIPNGELRSCTADFQDGDVPGAVQLRLQVYTNAPEEHDAIAPPAQSVEDSMLAETVYDRPDYLAEFSFELAFDAYYTAQGETIPVNQTFRLDGQTLTLTDAELYPTHIRLNFKDAPANTAWLKGLEFYLENQRGEKFKPISNGVSATGSIDSPMMESFRVESDFFRGSTTLTLHITASSWLDKDKERIPVDLTHKTAKNLPQGVEFESAKHQTAGWILTFTGEEFEENHFYQLFGSRYYDADGKEYEINSSSADMGD
ncbi:MAG: DUF4179 domain-containing protein, partial [Oscillibacter sp.]